jgi:hypothetical protein
MDIEFDKYIQERDSDPAMRRARKEYFGDETIKHTTRQRPTLNLGERDSGCSWIKVPRGE